MSRRAKKVKVADPSQPQLVGWKPIHSGPSGTEMEYPLKPFASESPKRKKQKKTHLSTPLEPQNNVIVEEPAPGVYTTEEMKAIDAMNETVEDPGRPKVVSDGQHCKWLYIC